MLCVDRAVVDMLAVRIVCILFTLAQTLQDGWNELESSDCKSDDGTDTDTSDLA